MGWGWGSGTPHVSGEQTFTAAHVDNDFQSSLLSCQQCHGLSQLLVSRLKIIIIINHVFFVSVSLIKVYWTISALGIENMRFGKVTEVQMSTVISSWLSRASLC